MVVKFPLRGQRFICFKDLSVLRRALQALLLARGGGVVEEERRRKHFWRR